MPIKATHINSRSFGLAGAFELVVSEQILSEIQCTLQKPQFKQRLLLQDGKETVITELIRAKATIVTADCYQTDMPPSVEVAKKLADTFDVTLDYIVDDTS